MFADNKYRHWHDDIIQRAKGRVVEGYVEKHHILPRCLGGGNEASNIVKLTFREHFLVHWLLTKFSHGVAFHKMLHAFLRMSSARRAGRDIKPWQRATICANIRGRKKSAEHAANIGKGLRGIKRSDEFKKKVSARHKGKKISEAQRKQASEFQRSSGLWTPERLAIWAERARKNHTGRKHSPEVRKRMSEAAKRRPLTEDRLAVLRIEAAKRKGKKQSPELTKKISDARKGKCSPKLMEHIRRLQSSNLGRQISSDTRHKMSKSQMGRKHSLETRLKISAWNQARNSKKSRQLSFEF